MIFKQKGLFFSRREFVIEQEGVKVIKRSFTGASEKLHDFHHIGKVIIRKRKRAWIILLLSLIFLCYGSWLVYNINDGGGQINTAVGSFLLSMAFLFSFFVLSPKFMYLWCKKHDISIEFLDNNPSEEELLTFIAHISKAQRVRLQQRYLTIDEYMSYDEHRKNIQWLRDNDFLSQKEAEQRLGESNVNFSGVD
ncbi:MAG: hypothetical protein ACNS60_02065 [Candidatus Cyclobacteriaceae bacterium M2_1C_046]